MSSFLRITEGSCLTIPQLARKTMTHICQPTFTAASCCSLAAPMCWWCIAQNILLLPLTFTTQLASARPPTIPSDKTNKTNDPHATYCMIGGVATTDKILERELANFLFGLNCCFNETQTSPPSLKQSYMENPSHNLVN